MEILWDDRHQPHTSLPWKLQRCHELNLTNASLMFHSGCHGNQVFIATRYEADAYCTSIPNVDSICLETKDLLTYHCGCHGNLVTIATRYAADAYPLKEPPYQIWTQSNLRQKNY